MNEEARSPDSNQETSAGFKEPKLPAPETLPELLNEQIDEIERPTDSFTSEFMIRIDDFRARQLSPRAALKLQSSLNEIALSVVAEALLIAVTELKDDPSPTISDNHIASSLLIVLNRRIRAASKRPWLRSLVENLTAGAFFCIGRPDRG